MSPAPQFDQNIPITPGSLYVFVNMELGDNIILNGAARWLARYNTHVSWVARQLYYPAVADMLSDIPNLAVVNGYDYPEARLIMARCPHKLVSGFFLEGNSLAPWPQFDRDFYRELGIYFINRWQHFGLPPGLFAHPLPGPREPFALVHEVPHRQFVLDPDKVPTHLPVRRIEQRHNFWDWLPDILAATELHFVDSSFLNLAESLYALGYLHDTKLVYHAYSKCRKHGGHGPVLLAPWKVYLP